MWVFWVKSVLCFRFRSDCRRSEGCNRAHRVQHGSVPERFPKTRERQAPVIRALAEEGIIAGKARNAKFRHPEAQAFLESLTDEQTAKQPLLIFEHDGVVARYWREVEGVADKQADGTAKTREAKVISCFTADGRDLKTGKPRKDKNSGAADVCIDSARAAGPRSSAIACGRSCAGTACSRPRRWRCCPTGCRGSESPARRFSPDGQ